MKKQHMPGNPEKVNYERSKAEILRKKAETLHKKGSFKMGMPQSEAETLKLIHELEVHQIELEMQNSELRHAWAIAEVAVNKYSELYDFAPTGFFTLSKQGEILSVNQSGAKMLGKERQGLVKSRLGFFVSDDTKQIFNLFLKKVFHSKTKETCELAFLTHVNILIYVQLIGVSTEDETQCYVTAIDITERKLVETAFMNKSLELQKFNHFMVGREIRMIELKREIDELLKKSGEKEKYVLHTKTDREK